jgi:hydroxymethylglutaryl-CoA reductase
MKKFTTAMLFQILQKKKKKKKITTTEFAYFSNIMSEPNGEWHWCYFQLTNMYAMGHNIHTKLCENQSTDLKVGIGTHNMVIS